MFVPLLILTVIKESYLHYLGSVGSCLRCIMRLVILWLKTDRKSVV